MEIQKVYIHMVYIFQKQNLQTSVYIYIYKEIYSGWPEKGENLVPHYLFDKCIQYRIQHRKLYFT